jgi:hypothetical protein
MRFFSSVTFPKIECLPFETQGKDAAFDVRKTRHPSKPRSWTQRE